MLNVIQQNRYLTLQRWVGFKKFRAQSSFLEKSRAKKYNIIKGARGAEALVAGFKKSRAQSSFLEKSRAKKYNIIKGARGAEALVAGFKKSRAQILINIINIINNSILFFKKIYYKIY